MEKTVRVCDKCPTDKQVVAIAKCFVCGADLCEDHNLGGPRNSYTGIKVRIYNDNFLSATRDTNEFADVCVDCADFIKGHQFEIPDHLWQEFMKSIAMWKAEVKEHGVKILQEPDVWVWIRALKGSTNRTIFYHIFTNELLEALEGLQKVPGVYSFYSADGICLYIGRSNNLRSRIPGSFSRFKPYNKPVYVKYMTTQTAGDAIVLEGYFIALMNPCLNAADSFQDGVTLTIEPMPEWSELILCNWVKFLDGDAILHTEE